MQLLLSQKLSKAETLRQALELDLDSDSDLGLGLGLEKASHLRPVCKCKSRLFPFHPKLSTLYFCNLHRKSQSQSYRWNSEDFVHPQIGWLQSSLHDFWTSQQHFLRQLKWFYRFFALKLNNAKNTFDIKISQRIKPINVSRIVVHVWADTDDGFVVVGGGQAEDWSVELDLCEWFSCGLVGVKDENRSVAG